MLALIIFVFANRNHDKCIDNWLTSSLQGAHYTCWKAVQLFISMCFSYCNCLHVTITSSSQLTYLFFNLFIKALQHKC